MSAGVLLLHRCDIYCCGVDLVTRAVCVQLLTLMSLSET